jgi:hypothetical protein
MATVLTPDNAQRFTPNDSQNKQHDQGLKNHIRTRSRRQEAVQTSATLWLVKGSVTAFIANLPLRLKNQLLVQRPSVRELR